jgi:hypothetical protein
MSMDPKALWSMPSPTSQLQVGDDVAAVLTATSGKFRTGRADAPGAQDRGLHPAADAQPDLWPISKTGDRGTCFGDAPASLDAKGWN